MDKVFELLLRTADKDIVFNRLLKACGLVLVLLMIVSGYVLMSVMCIYSRIRYLLCIVVVLCLFTSVVLAGRYQFNKDLYDMGTQAMSSAGNYLAIKNRCGGDYVIDLWHYDAQSGYSLVTSRTGTISSPSSSPYIWSSIYSPQETGNGYGVSYCSGSGNGYECGCTYVLENSTWSSLGINSFVDPGLVTSTSDYFNPYLGFYVCDATNASEVAYKIKRINAMGEGDIGYYDVSNLPFDVAGYISYPCNPINVPTTTTTSTTSTSTTTSTTDTSTTSTTDTSTTSSTSTSTTSTTTNTIVNSSTTTTTLPSPDMNSTNSILSAILSQLGQGFNSVVDSFVDFKNTFVDLFTIDSAQYDEISDNMSSGEITSEIPDVGQDSTPVPDTWLQSFIDLLKSHPIYAAIIGSHIDIADSQCSFSINIYSRDISFDFCQYQSHFAWLGLFFVAFSTLFSFFIIIGKG